MVDMGKFKKVKYSNKRPKGAGLTIAPTGFHMTTDIADRWKADSVDVYLNEKDKQMLIVRADGDEGTYSLQKNTMGPKNTFTAKMLRREVLELIDNDKFDRFRVAGTYTEKGEVLFELNQARPYERRERTRRKQYEKREN